MTSHEKIDFYSILPFALMLKIQQDLYLSPYHTHFKLLQVFVGIEQLQI